MPLIDKPLPELLAYPGINPCPADHTEYWNAALAELDQCPPRPELIPADTGPLRNSECFHLWFQGIGGARLHAKLVRPKKTSPLAPVVLQFHGYSGNSGDWVDKLAWTSEGIAVAALDCRGQGGMSTDPGGVQGTTLRGHIIRGLDDPDPSRLFMRQQFLDTVQLARAVAGVPGIDPDRMGCHGASQGGALSLVCAALEPRIRKCVSVFPFLCDYQRVWQMDLCANAYEELKYYFKLFDPRHEREMEVFTRLGYIDVQFLASRIKAETILHCGLMDTICPPSTQFAAYNKIRAPKKHLIYPDFGHENLPGQSDHSFSFLLGLHDG